ncbi:MAG TPA: DUF92 domain-containing protein [Gemmatimonadaceae bacterium]
MITRAVVGFLVACAIVLAGSRAGWLTRGGAVAALVVGTVSVGAGWSWGALVIAFFVTSSALSQLRASTRAQRTNGIVAKGGARDAAQVLANGGLFTLAALLSLLAPWDGWMALGAGALAAATADTWGTEIGTLAAAPPRLITTWQAVPAGTSGAVTPEGLLASAAGAIFIALVIWLLHWPTGATIAAVAGGVAGALTDSLLGALWQARRWCARCDIATERAVHSCGAPTRHSGGLAWLDNDGVNFLSGAAGAAVGLLLVLQ